MKAVKVLLVAIFCKIYFSFGFFFSTLTLDTYCEIVNRHYDNAVFVSFAYENCVKRHLPDLTYTWEWKKKNRFRSVISLLVLNSRGFAGNHRKYFQVILKVSKTAAHGTEFLNYFSRSKTLRLFTPEYNQKIYGATKPFLCFASAGNRVITSDLYA